MRRLRNIEKRIKLVEDLLNGKKEYIQNNTTPEYALTLSIFIALFVLMTTACVFRLFGIGWFRADYSSIHEPALWIQEIVKLLLFWFETAFVMKILSNQRWLKTICLSFTLSVIVFFLCFHPNNMLQATANTLCIYAVSVYYLKTKTVKSVALSVLYTTVLIIIMSGYGALMLYGRFRFNVELKSDYVTSVLSAIDYKLLPVVTYYGLKLYKIKKRSGIRG